MSRVRFSSSLQPEQPPSKKRFMSMHRQSQFLRHSVMEFDQNFKMLQKREKTVDQIVKEKEMEEVKRLQDQQKKEDNTIDGKKLALSSFLQMKESKCKIANMSQTSQDIAYKFINKLQSQRYLKKNKDTLLINELIDQNQENIAFLRRVKEKYGEEPIKQIIKCLKPESYRHKNIIYNFGKVVDKMFILLVGSVNILCPTYSKYQYEVKPDRIEFQVRRDGQDKEIDRFFDSLRLVKSLHPFQCFGEVHLWNRLPQTCTAICKGDVLMATLHQQDFQRILSDVYKDSELQQQRLFDRRLEQHYELLSQVQGLKIIDRSDIGLLVHLCDTRNYKQHQIVYREEDTSDYLYIVKEGEVRLGQPMCQQLSIKEQLSQEKDIRNREVYRDGGRDDHQYLWLSRAIPGQMFGDQEVQQGAKRHYTAISTNGNTQLLRLKVADLRNNLSAQSLARFNQMSQEKWNFVMNKDVAKSQGRQQKPEEFIYSLNKESDIRNYQHFQIDELTKIKMEQTRQPLVIQDSPMRTKKEHDTLQYDMHQEFIKRQTNSKKFFEQVSEPRPKKVVELKQKDVRRFIEKISPLKRKQILRDFHNDDLKYLLNELSTEHLIFLSQCRIRKQHELEIKTNYLKFLQDKDKADKFDLISLREVLREEFKKKVREQEKSNQIYRQDMPRNKKGAMFRQYQSTDRMIVHQMAIGMDKAQSCKERPRVMSEGLQKGRDSLRSTSNVFYRGQQIQGSIKGMKSRKVIRLDDFSDYQTEQNGHKSSIGNQSSSSAIQTRNRYYHAKGLKQNRTRADQMGQTH